MDGIIIINKTKGCTSHDVVYKIKKMLNKKVGHTGTLDPMAEGVLPILIGKGTQLSKYLINHDKKYIVELQLGIKTDTADSEGKIIEEKTVNKTKLSKENITNVLQTFIGKQEQIPPIYSAIKVNGKKLYEYAREGKSVELPIKKVIINKIELLNVNQNKFTFKCNVSKGTYIRSLINDICKKLGTIGCMSDLIRTKQGNFYIEDSIDLEDINEDTKLINMVDVIDFPILEVNEYLYNRIKNGSKLENRYNYEKLAFTYNKELIGIYIIDPKDSSKIKPKNIFN